MALKNQAGKLLRKRMVDLDLSVTELAQRVQRPRPSVSKAIHTDKFPLLRRQIREALGV